MAGMVVRSALAGAVFLTLAACGGGGGATVASTTTPRPNTAFSGFAECAFAPGGPVTTAGLATANSMLAVSWDTPQTIPTTGSSALVITVGPYRIGLERDGVEPTRYLFDSTTGKKTELTGPYTETEDGISVVLPMRAVPKLNERVPWHASVTIDDTQVARCPAKGASRFGEPPE